MEFQSLFHKKLLEGTFVYTAESTPPDAADQNILLRKTKHLKGIADAVNLTDSPGAKVHMSALTAAIILVQNDIEPILQLTVRMPKIMQPGALLAIDVMILMKS